MELLEREPYLAELEAALPEARAGAGRVIWVSGEAGIGKTTLVERFTSSHQNDLNVWWGVCDSLFTPRPLGPLHDIAAQMKGDLLDQLNSEADRTTIFSTFLGELQRHATIVVVEDAHWADEASLDLIKYLGRRIQRTLALLIVTYRDDELGPQHPLRSVLGDLSSSLFSRRISLKPLSETAVQALVGGRAIDASALFRQTGGNPFFVTEVLSSAEGGHPATVRDAVLARTTRLSLSAQAVLQAAAVIGPRIEPWVLAEVTGAEVGATEECLGTGILIPQADMLGFRHELARHTILETISPPRRQVLHRLTLQALKRSPAARHDLARLAHHAEASGDRDAVLEFAPAAARSAAAAGAHREAAALYGLTLRAGSDVPDADRGLLLDEYASELHTIGALEESTAIRRQAIETLREAGDHRQEGLNLALLAVTLINTGQPAAARQASREALDLLQALPPGPELALAQRTQAHLLMLNRDCDEAVAWGNQAIELAGRYNDRETLLRAYTTVGAALLLTDHERGRSYLERCFTLTPGTGSEFGIANVYANLGSISCEVFRLREAETYLREGLAYTGERDLDFLGKYMQAWLALTLVYLGRWEEAWQSASEALQGIGVTVIGRIPALAALGRLSARQGKGKPASFLAEAFDLAMQSQTFQRVSLVRAARAEAAWLAGDQEGAREEASAIYDLAVSKHHPWFAGELAFWLWQAGEVVEPPGWVARPYALHFAGEWRRAAEEWDRLGCPYEQACALAEGDPPAQISALEIFERLGAAPAAERARQKLRAAGLSQLPRKPRASSRSNPFGLTDRQVEILLLLADGLSNAEIASRLHITPKTADHHVSAVLAKLDVHSRQAAADLARRHPQLNKK
jgi:DNA-binding CsgD family transcriptional regulator/tetratricopeptide (TPR) repeat protein